MAASKILALALVGLAMQACVALRRPLQDAKSPSSSTPVSASTSGTASSGQAASAKEQAQLQLRWSDEFVPREAPGYINGGIDTSIWNLHIGDGADYGVPGWANEELQCFTDARENARIVPSGSAAADGMLLIEALSKPRHTCRNLFARNITMDFTSAKLTTNQKRSVSWTGTPGASHPVMLTARIKTKVGPRAWPAFWLLPTTNETFCSGCGVYGGWCVSGEIDVMERINGEPYVYSTAHYGGSDKNHFDDCRFTRGTKNYASSNDAGEWRTYTLVWDSTYIRTYMDGALVLNIAPGQPSVPDTFWSAMGQVGNKYAPFDQPFHVILNVAVGGKWPGITPPNPSELPYQMYVDYVRVYDVKCPAAGAKELSCSDGIDNDCDGLMDQYDPDCQQPTNNTAIIVGAAVGGGVAIVLVALLVYLLRRWGVCCAGSSGAQAGKQQAAWKDDSSPDVASAYAAGPDAVTKASAAGK